MGKTRELVKRRKAIRNIRRITRTMELIATARFKKAAERATRTAEYTRKIAELVRDLSVTATDITHPLLETRDPVKNSLLLVITSNRGLCGGYNAGILREANIRIRDIRQAGITLHLEVAGKRGMNSFRYQRVPVEKSYTQFEDKPTFEQVKEIADHYLSLYLSGAIDRVDVAFMKYLSSSKQTPVLETLLPLGSVTGGNAAAPASTGTPLEYEFLPDARSILEDLLPVTFRIRLFKCFLDAGVSEQIFRRLTMSQATDNADDMIRLLTSQYNRARQAQITKEIAEVIGGAAALE
jgi:F-type H+-transporting ATPase subunit gamma